MVQPDAQEIPHLRAELSRGRLGAVEEHVSRRLASMPPGDKLALELRLLRAMAWRRSGRRREAAAELELLATNCRVEAEAELAAAVELERAKLVFATGDLLTSAAMVQQVLEEARAAGFALLEAEACHLRGLIHSSAGEISAAEELLTAALHGFEKLSEWHRAADSRSMLGMTLVAQGRNLEGINLWRKSLVYHENEGNTAEVAHDLERLGFAAWCEGDMAQTRSTLQRVLQIDAQEPGVVTLQVIKMTHCNLGGVELLEQRLETALEHFAQAERIAQQLGDNMILSSVYLSRAEIALLRGRYSEAAAQAQAAELAAAEIRYSLPLHSQMSLALVAAVCEGPAAARAKWPAPPYPPFRADKNVTLRGVQLLLRAVLGRADNAEAVELYHAWGSSLEQLIST